MTTTTLVIAILVVLGLVLGYRTAQSSKNREALHGGALSELFHYLASACTAMLAPTILTSVFILHLSFGQLVLVALGIFGAGIIFAVLHALFEKPALAATAANDRGWTENDARASGL